MYQLKVTTSAKYKDSKTISFTAVTTVEGRKKQLTITSTDKKYLEDKEALRIKTVNKLLAKIWHVNNDHEVDNQGLPVSTNSKFTISSDLRRLKDYVNTSGYSVKFHNVSVNMFNYKNMRKADYIELIKRNNFKKSYLTWY